MAGGIVLRQEPTDVRLNDRCASTCKLDLQSFPLASFRTAIMGHGHRADPTLLLTPRRRWTRQFPAHIHICAGRTGRRRGSRSTAAWSGSCSTGCACVLPGCGAHPCCPLPKALPGLV